MKVNAIGDVAAFRKGVSSLYEKYRQGGNGSLLELALSASK